MRLKLGKRKLWSYLCGVLLTLGMLGCAKPESPNVFCKISSWSVWVGPPPSNLPPAPSTCRDVILTIIGALAFACGFCLLIASLQMVGDSFLAGLISGCVAVIVSFIGAALVIQHGGLL